MKHCVGGVIQLSTTVNLQPTTIYNLTIVAISSSLTSIPEILTVVVTLVNTAPVFSQAVYSVSFPEKCGQEVNGVCFSGLFTSDFSAAGCLSAVLYMMLSKS